MKTKTLRWFTTILFISLLGLALGGCGGSSGGGGGNPPGNPTTGTISGTVAGTEIVAVDDTGTIVASDDTTGKTADPITGNFAFTLTGIPVGSNIRIYLITDSGVYPLYFDSTGGGGVADTNVFSLSTVATIDLGFVDTTLVPGQAIPGINPVSVASVDPQTENTSVLVLVTDENTGTPLSGATVIIDHATDPRQVATTTAAGSASFTLPSGGPVTVTIGIIGSTFILTLVDFNLVFLNVSINDSDPIAFIQGTASNYTGPGFIEEAYLSNGDWLDDCPTCENLDEGTPGFYKRVIELPNRQYALSAFDFVGGGTPINFTAATGIGPLTDGQTLTVDLTFPITPPATTTTTGTITVPTSLVFDEVAALGLSDLGDQGELRIGLSPMGTSSPYPYTLTTFEFTGGASDDIGVWAGGIEGEGETFAIRRGVGFGGTGVDFTLIDIPTNLLPTGACGSIAPTFSWTAVPGASFYLVALAWDWDVVVDGGSTSFDLPDLTGTPLAGLGLPTVVPVTWDVQAIVVPSYSFNTIDEDTARRLMTDRSISAIGTCTP